MKKGFLLLSLIIAFTGCNKNLRSTLNSKGVTDINTVPDTFEPGFDLDKQAQPVQPKTPRTKDPQNPDDDQNIIPPAPEDKTTPATKPTPGTPGGKPSQGSGQPKGSGASSVGKSTAIKTSLEASRIIYYAQKVIELEARKLGTACNRFILRVLSLSGFANDGFIANDFDNYAAKNFSHVRAVKFQIDNNGDSLNRLKIHIWSYPERTPFIMQWSRSGGHGHVALLERIQDKLVIYQASLNSQYPNKRQTLLKAMINKNGREHLTVYSEMSPKVAKGSLAKK